VADERGDCGVSREKKVVIAGPNGAGKTTFATEFLPNEAGCPVFVNADLAVARVAARVAQGGHSVAETVVRRRFAAGWRNFNQRYKLLADAWVHYDNSGQEPVMVDQGAT
jgi:predicted ABC-type ATPase